MALYYIPQSFFDQLGIIPTQQLLKAVVLRAPNGDVQYEKTHHTPEVPQIRQRFIVIDGFLSATSNSQWDVRDSVVGQPIENGYRNAVPIRSGYVTFIPMQASGDNGWRSTNKVTEEHPPRPVASVPAASGHSGAYRIDYEDAPEGHWSGSRVDIRLFVEGVEQVPAADLAALQLILGT